MDTLFAGMAETTITPPVGVELAGYSPRTAEGIHDDLKAIALVLDDGTRKIAICVMDAVGVKPDLVAAVRRQSSNGTAIPAKNIFIAATHTHSGPALGGENQLNREWLAELEGKLVDVIGKADATRRPVRVGAAVGQVDGVGGNRRDPAHGPVDRSVNVLRFNDAASGEIIGVVVNHACHATTLGRENTLVTADYPGQARLHIAEKLEGSPIVMFLNGACGNINPGGYSAEASALGKIIPNRTFARAAEIGRQLGGEVVRLLPEISAEGPARVGAGRMEIRLPIKDTKSPDEAAADAKQKEERFEELKQSGAAESEIDRAWLDVMYARRHEQHARQKSELPNGEMTTELQGIALGDILFLGFPGELFTEIGLAVKESSPFRHTFVVGYANDGAGYFPTVDALQGGGYEVLTCRFGPSGIEQLTAAAQRLAAEVHGNLAD